MKYACTAILLAVSLLGLSACSDDDGIKPVPQTTATIAPDAGATEDVKIAGPAGGTIFVDPTALIAPTKFTIKQGVETPLVLGEERVSNVIDITADQVAFGTVDITLTLPMLGTNDINSVVMYHVAAGSNTVQTLNNVTVDATAKTVTGQTTSFSRFWASVAVQTTPPAPTISSVSPASGSTAGGTAITINGNNFAFGTNVSIGGVSASNVVIVSKTRITCTTPSGSAGAVNVEVMNTAGTATRENGYTYTAPTGGGGGGTLTATWSAIPTTGAPSGRSNMGLDGAFGDLWIFGGMDGTGVLGDFYHMANDFNNIANSTWNEVTATGGPSARRDPGMASATVGVNFDTYICVWGGIDGSGNGLGDGFLYAPPVAPANRWEGTWMAMSSTDAPSARSGNSFHVHSGKVYVWGGRDAPTSYLNDGAIYDIATDTWTAITTTGAPAARYAHASAVANTDGKLYVFGGRNATGDLNDLYVYDPGTDAWTELDDGSGANAPSARRGAAGFFRSFNIGLTFAGPPNFEVLDPGTDYRRFMVWGGEATGELGDGAYWDVVNGGWTTLPTTGAPAARQSMAFASTGGFGAAIFGGFGSGSVLGGGASYQEVDFAPTPDVLLDAWKSFPTTNAPSARQDAGMAYIGSLIVWGGRDSTNTYLNTGGQLKESQ